MKNKTILAMMIAIAVAAGGYAAYRFGVRQGMKSMPMSDGATALVAGAAAKQPLYWHDPMTPGGPIHDG